MTGIRLSLILLSAALLAAPFSGAFADGKGDPSTALRVLKEDVRFVQLPNGLRLLMYKRGIAPVFSAVIAVRVGSSDEVPGETGISHMFEHMAFKGTESIGTQDYKKEGVLLDELEDIAARTDGARTMDSADRARWDEIQKTLTDLWVPEEFSREYEKVGATGLNASTGADLTQYYVSLPRDAFGVWCRMESERLRKPVLRQFYQERDVVHEEQRSRSEDDPGGKLSETLFGVAFLMHSYRQPIIGYVSDIERLTARKLDVFRSRFYVPGNIVIALVGDVDPGRDAAMVERYFGTIPSGPMPERTQIVEQPQEGERRATINFHASPQFYVAYKKPQYPDPDDAPISVMTETLAGGRTTPLFLDLVERRKVATSVNAGETPGTAYPNLLTFSVIPRAPHSNEEVLSTFDSVVREFREKKVGEEDLQIAKRSIAMSYLESMDSSMDLAQSLVSSELLHGGWRSLIDWYEQAMKTSPEDVQRVARKYLDNNARTVAKLEPEKGGPAK